MATIPDTTAWKATMVNHTFMTKIAGGLNLKNYLKNLLRRPYGRYELCHFSQWMEETSLFFLKTQYNTNSIVKLLFMKAKRLQNPDFYVTFITFAKNPL